MAKEQKKVNKTEQPPVEQQPQPAETALDKPKTDEKSEPPKTETKKSKSKVAEKKSVPKDKSEKPPVANDTETTAPPVEPPKNGKPKLVVKNDAEKQRKAAIAAEVKRLQALNVPKEDIEMLIAAKFPPVNKPKSEKPPVETSARDKMFPKEFEVEGIKFRRVELVEQKDANVKSLGFMPAILDAKNAEPEGHILCLAFQWSEDMLAPSGTKGVGKSLYEKYSGVTPPAKFPHDLEMCPIDAILVARLEQFISHSLYTENPGYTNFSVFNKRTKEGWFDCNNAPCEIYLADFREFDFANGVFVDLYGK